MADDAAPRPQPRLTDADLSDLSAAVAEAAFVDEQAALDHAMELWRADRAEHQARLRTFLEERSRLAGEARARGELIPMEQVFADFRHRATRLMADGARD